MNHPNLKSAIRKALKFEMKAKGYEFNETNPDLLVNFRILDEPVTYTGYVETFEDEEYYGPDELRLDAIGLVPDAEVREAEDKREYYLEKGTLMVHLTDTETSELVWQGFVSGLMEADKFDKDEAKIEEAVHRLFTDEFDQISSQ